MVITLAGPGGQAGAELALPVLLAPMAGITDLPFRRLVARFGAGLVVSEMVASRDMVRGRAGARARAELDFAGPASAVQIAGREAEWMAEAARMAEAGGARIIDINMGCPAKRVTSASGDGATGSGLLREQDLALRLIEAVVGAVSVPVTLKTRLGWDEATGSAAPLLARAEAAGIRMVTVHGRTRCQFYTGRADWAAIGRVTAGLAVPVVANGDIDGPATATAALQASGAAGVMVGRAARGRPWLLAQIAAALAGKAVPAPPQGAALAGLVAGHYEAMLSFHGRDMGLRAARKHLGWYMDHAATLPGLRRRVLTETCPDRVLALLPEAFDGPLPGAQAA